MADPGKYAIKTYPGNGTGTEFWIDFPYLDKAHVIVTLQLEAGPVVVQARPSQYDFSKQNLFIEFVEPPPSGSEIVFRRETPAEELVEDFADGSPVTAERLRRAALQPLYFAAEIADQI